MTIKNLANIIHIDTNKESLNNYYIYVGELYSNDMNRNLLRKKANNLIIKLLEYNFITSFKIEIRFNNNNLICYVRGNLNINDFINELNKQIKWVQI